MFNGDLAGVHQNPDGVEPNLSVGNLLLTAPTGCQPANPCQLGMSYCLQRRPNRQGCASFDLHKDEGLLFGAHDVELTIGEAPVSVQNLIAVANEVFAGAVFAVAAEPLSWDSHNTRLAAESGAKTTENHIGGKVAKRRLLAYRKVLGKLETALQFLDVHVLEGADFDRLDEAILAVHVPDPNVAEH